MSYVSTESLRKSFLLGKSRIDVLKGIDFSFGKGEFISIVGTSGAGKSTFLHIIGGLDKPTDGRVMFEDRSIFDSREENIAVYRNKTVGFIFQFHNLLPEFTALENAAIPMMISGSSRLNSLSAAESVLKEVGLEHRKNHKPGEMSGGEQQRVAIARSLINNPSILLADEPTGNLDSETGEEIFELLIREKKARGMTLVMVTHNEELARRADLTVRLKDGVIFKE
jgi:lipoprotein-releasing system ATP-binding protein